MLRNGLVDRVLEGNWSGVLSSRDSATGAIGAGKGGSWLSWRVGTKGAQGSEWGVGGLASRMAEGCDCKLGGAQLFPGPLGCRASGSLDWAFCVYCGQGFDTLIHSGISFVDPAGRSSWSVALAGPTALPGPFLGFWANLNHVFVGSMVHARDMAGVDSRSLVTPPARGDSVGSRSSDGASMWAGPWRPTGRGRCTDDLRGGGPMFPDEGEGGANPTPWANPPRKSARLAGSSKGGALEKAILRKTNFREGADPAGPSSCRVTARSRELLSGGGEDGRRLPRHNKILRKGVKCGIHLSDEDVRYFRDFIGASS